MYSTCLDPDRLEAIEYLKHSWRCSLKDLAAANDDEAQAEFMQKFEDFAEWDEEARKIDVLVNTGSYDSD